MNVALKIWRYDSKTGDRALKEYEVDVGEEATLLDCLDVIKDRIDGTLAYRKSCRMMICGPRSARVPVISAMRNLPIIKDLVVDMQPFWRKIRAVEPYLQPGYDQATEKENVVTRGRMAVVHKGSLCIMCGCCGP